MVKNGFCFSDDRMSAYSGPFSTFDADNDGSSYTNCAAKYSGGWWFGGCHSKFLNGLWHSDDWGDPWHPQYTSGRQVNGTSMLIK